MGEAPKDPNVLAPQQFMFPPLHDVQSYPTQSQWAAHVRGHQPYGSQSNPPYTTHYTQPPPFTQHQGTYEPYTPFQPSSSQLQNPYLPSVQQQDSDMNTSRSAQLARGMQIAQQHFGIVANRIGAI